MVGTRAIHSYQFVQSHYVPVLVVVYLYLYCSYLFNNLKRSDGRTSTYQFSSSKYNYRSRSINQSNDH
jgi:hypothetical protein